MSKVRLVLTNMAQEHKQFDVAEGEAVALLQNYGFQYDCTTGDFDIPEDQMRHFADRCVGYGFLLVGGDERWARVLVEALSAKGVIDVTSYITSVKRRLGGHFGRKLFDYLTAPSKDGLFEAYMFADGRHRAALRAAFDAVNNSVYGKMDVLFKRWLNEAGVGEIVLPGRCVVDQHLPGVRVWLEELERNRAK